MAYLVIIVYYLKAHAYVQFMGDRRYHRQLVLLLAPYLTMTIALILLGELVKKYIIKPLKRIHTV